MSDLDRFRCDGPLAAGLQQAGVGVPTGQLVPSAVAAVGVILAAVLVGFGTVPEGGTAATSIVAVAWLLAIAGSSGQAHPRLQWPVPALLRATEYLAVLALAGPSPWTFGLLSALAFHHYDVVYRLRGGGPAPVGWVAVVTGGWDLRLALLLVASLFGWTGVAVVALTVLVAPIVVGESVSSWWRHSRPTSGVT